MSSDTYILIERVPVLENDILKWAEYFQSRFLPENDCIVEKTKIAGGEVSTVFLGIDHNWPDGPPLLFETMIFGIPEFEDYQERYSTWEQAVAGHNAAINILRSAKGDSQ